MSTPNFLFNVAASRSSFSWSDASTRIDPSSDAPLGIPANVWASFVAIGLGVLLIVVQSRRHPEPETSIYQVGREPEPLQKRDVVDEPSGASVESQPDAWSGRVDDAHHSEVLVVEDVAVIDGLAPET